MKDTKGVFTRLGLTGEAESIDRFDKELYKKRGALILVNYYTCIYAYKYYR